jgi:phenylpropionate dioxygenase-like ring-hydroxylating dioxygenase large terminal subunit
MPTHPSHGNADPTALVDGSFADHPVLTGFWYAVALGRELTIEPRRVTVLKRHMAIWRDGAGRVVAFPDRCPHRNAPLSAGQVHDGCLVCPYHGWTFDGTGTCVAVPSAGPGAAIPPRAHLQPLHCVERYGLVWVCPGEPRAGIPEMPWEDDPSFRRFNNPVERWTASATRMVDNFLDYSHFPYVHLGTFGGATDEEIPNLELGPLPDGWYGYGYDVVVSNDAGGQDASGQATRVVQRHMTTGFTLPFAVRSTIEYGTGLRHMLLLLSTPIDDVTSWFTFVVWRNADHDRPEDEVMAFDRQIGHEDRLMLERLDGPLPFGNDGTVSVQSDKGSVEWRRRLRGVLAGESGVGERASEADGAR